MYLDSGFILSKETYDTAAGIHFIIWLLTPSGPLKVITQPEKILFFIKAVDKSRANALLNKRIAKVCLEQVGLNNFQQQPMVGCYFTTLKCYYRAAKLLKENNISVYEDDIRPVDRFLMERFIKGAAWVQGKLSCSNNQRTLINAQLKPYSNATVQFKTVSLDIECDGQGVLFSIGLVGNGLDHVLMVGGERATNELPFSVLWCVDEIDLLTQLQHLIQSNDPDVIIGWNVIEFDFTVLFIRAEALGIELRLGRHNEKILLRKGYFTRLTIPGRVVIDGIDTLKNATYNYDSFSLSNVAAKELSEQKLIGSDNRLSEIVRQFNEDKLALASYNRQDCILVKRLFEKLNLLDFAVVRSQLTGLELERMGGSVAAFTNLYLPLLHRSGYVAPNLGEHGLTFESPGGYVMESTPGLYKNVIVLDFKSLYPSIMRTFCIDPLGLIKGLEDVTDAIPGFHDASFSRSFHHLPNLIKELAASRQLAKETAQPMLSQAIKIIMNSLYGVLGSKGCRFYDPRLSSSITLRGHEIMQKTRKWIEELGYTVIYGDTDSTFVSLDEQLSIRECEALGQKLAQIINAKWQMDISERFSLTSYLEIEFETHYSPFFMPTIRGKATGSKKRYVGQVDNNGNKELIFKGMETVRSDWTAMAQQFQVELFETLFDSNFKLEMLTPIVEDYTLRLYAGEFDNKLVYRKRLGQHLVDYQKNIPPHVQAAKKYQAINPDFEVTKGQVIEYVYTHEGARLHLNGNKLDYVLYVEKQIKPIAQMILQPLKLDFKSIKSNQLNLFQ